jgi:hypothetical protein
VKYVQIGTEVSPKWFRVYYQGRLKEFRMEAVYAKVYGLSERGL